MVNCVHACIGTARRRTTEFSKNDVEDCYRMERRDFAKKDFWDFAKNRFSFYFKRINTKIARKYDIRPLPFSIEWLVSIPGKKMEGRIRT